MSKTTTPRLMKCERFYQRKLLRSSASYLALFEYFAILFVSFEIFYLTFVLVLLSNIAAHFKTWKKDVQLKSYGTKLHKNSKPYGVLFAYFNLFIFNVAILDVPCNLTAGNRPG